MRERIGRVCAVLLIVLFSWYGASTSAENIDGVNSPDFVSAVVLWLDNDDQQSLPVLAELAAAGNSAARILLARIEHTSRAPSQFIENLDRAERIALFRAPDGGGQFAPSWLQIESDRGNQLARAFLDSRKPFVNLDLIKRLREAGEYQATDHPLRIASIYGTAEQKAQLLANKFVLDEMIPYILSFKAQPEIQSDGIEALRLIVENSARAVGAIIDDDEPDTRQAARYLALGLPFGQLRVDNPWRKPLASWMRSASVARPITAVCEQQCSKDMDACVLVLFGLSGGYYEVIRLDSPVETIIPQSEFLNSHRAQAVALRQAALTRAETGEELLSVDDIATMSSCAAQLVAEQRSTRADWDR